MSALEEIFEEYINMRNNGLETNETLRILRSNIESLPKTDKGEVARYIRLWEKGETAPLSTRQASNQDKSSVRSIVPDANSSETSKNTEKLPNSGGIKSLNRNPIQSVEVADEASWVSCANCDAKSRTDAVFCYKCGYMLNTKGAHDTKQFTDALGGYDTHYYGNESLLVLRPRDATTQIELRPQLQDHELVIGRITENDVMRPDVDLSDYDADNLGVSRLHVAIRHAKHGNTLQIYDLGSANGTFINGQRLHPKEERILRKGDDIRLGRMVINVDYYHPGEEI